MELIAANNFLGVEYDFRINWIIQIEVRTMFSILRTIRRIDSKNQLLVAIIFLLAVVWVFAPLRTADSQQDEAEHIYQLARALNSDDIDQQNFTYWINGNIGKDIGLPPLIVALGKPMPDFTFKSLNS